MKQKTFMKKGTLFLFIFLLSLFFIGVVEAQPPFSPLIVEEGIEIAFPQFNTMKQGQNFTFHFHVMNVTDGVFFTDADDITCSYHLYNSVGGHIFQRDNDVAFDAPLDWEVKVLSGNFSQPASFGYLFECNSTSIGVGGSVAIGFEVTPTGLDDTYTFYVIILLITAVLLIWGFSIRDPWVIIFGTFGLYFSGLYIILNGIVGIKDMVTTWAIGLILLGLAAYLSIRAAQEVMNG